MERYEGRCQCGDVTFCVEADITEVTTRGCLLCAWRNALMAIVPEDALKVLVVVERLSCYTWNTGLAKHDFCSTCGIYLSSRAKQKYFSVNVFCVQNSD